MEAYAGIVPYIYGAVLRLRRHRQGFHRLDPDHLGLENRRFRIAGLAIIFSMKRRVRCSS